jgi:hypothetical protein
MVTAVANKIPKQNQFAALRPHVASMPKSNASAPKKSKSQRITSPPFARGSVLTPFGKPLAQFARVSPVIGA